MAAASPDSIVFILDDDPLFGELTASVAQKSGFVPVVFDTPAALDRGCASRAPDLIILDLALGERDGVSVLEQLRRMRCAAPVIVISGCDQRTLTSARRVGSALGLTMLDPLQKPVNPVRLKEALEQVRRTIAPLRHDDLGEALKRLEFTPYYQPKLELAQRRPVGVEALVRWRHPQRGLLMPGAFIPLLETGDTVTPLTLYMIERALAERRTSAMADRSMTVAVNVCARSLVEADFPDRVAEIVKESGCRPSDLMLEITETSAMSDTALTMAALSRLRIQGFGLSMDDFGTGYSSLRELHRMPFTELKIDRSFVTEMETDSDARKIVEAVVCLSRALGLKSVAEGVEDEQTLRLLTDMGCDVAQGYLIGRPMPADSLGRWLAAHDGLPHHPPVTALAH